MKKLDITKRYSEYLNPFFKPNLKFENIEIKVSEPELKWLEELINQIVEWRGIFTTNYLKWAVAINGLCIGSERYENQKDNADFAFVIASQRLNSITQTVSQEVIFECNGLEASELHKGTIPLIISGGFIDLYNSLEDFIFEMYRTYLFRNPDSLLKGNQYASLRKLRRKSRENENKLKEWEAALKERIEKWQHKKLYEGLGRTFLAFCNTVEISAFSKLKTTIEDWAESITGIALVRNALVHRQDIVSKELNNFCLKPHSLGFSFKEGEPLKIELFHLQALELFTQQLLSAINLSLVEKYMKI